MILLVRENENFDWQWSTEFYKPCNACISQNIIGKFIYRTCLREVGYLNSMILRDLFFLYFKEAYEEFKHVLLAFIYDKDDQSSPVANEVG